MTLDTMPRRKRMKRKMSVLLAATLFAATPALSAETKPAANDFNCDFDPACEVSPGIYGNLSAPATSKFNLSIGGFIKADYVYNSANYGATGFLSPTNSPKDSSIASKKDQSLFSIRQSRLWFRSTGPNLFSAKTSAYLEFDFHNTNNSLNNSENLNATPRIRHAYGLLNWGTTQLLFGQTSDTHSFLTNANFFDFSGGAQAGFVSNTRNAQIRLTQRFDLDKDKNNAITAAFAVQQPYQNNYNNTGTTATAGQTISVTSTSVADTWGGLPAFSGKLAFTSKSLGSGPILYGQGFSPLTIGVSGLYGSSKIYTYANTTTAERHTKNVDSYYGALYAFLPIISSKDGRNRANTLSFEAQTYLAANVKDATAYQFIGQNATTTSDSRINPARGFGIATSLIYFPTQNIGLSGGYGRRQILAAHDYTNISNVERYNQMYFVNAAYDLNAAIRVGLELLHFDTAYGNVATVKDTASSLYGTSKKGTSETVRVSLYYYF
jgi:hypothetical protein